MASNSGGPTYLRGLVGDDTEEAFTVTAAEAAALEALDLGAPDLDAPGDRAAEE